MTSILNSWVTLAKLRPGPMTAVIVSTLCSWTPAAFVNQPAFNIRSVEKVARVLLIHLSRCVFPHFTSFTQRDLTSGFP